ncbi:MAG: alpha-ketoglutarate-dependent dioxygenase AlkB [Acidimicrobiales bacterium]
MTQPSLFGAGEPSFDHRFAEVRRLALARGAWIDHQPGWLHGHQALFDTLVAEVDWQQARRPMYDRMVDVPRLTGEVPSVDGDPCLKIVADMADAIGSRYQIDLPRLSVALYRDGNDSVAWHGDQVARDLPTALVATVSVGEPRKFCLRPKGGGESIRFKLGHGDLVVMGGTCQRTWDHGIPKVANAGPRIAIMFRPNW